LGRGGGVDKNGYWAGVAKLFLAGSNIDFERLSKLVLGWWQIKRLRNFKIFSMLDFKCAVRQLFCVSIYHI